jgi:vancomycin permeability regulator SanA
MIRRILSVLFSVALLACLSLVTCDRFISYRAAPYLYDSISDIPLGRPGCFWAPADI